MTIQATLCFIVHDGKVLLLKKSPGLIGEGKWNAPGGKMLEGEEARDCAVREVLEETQLRVKEPDQLGILYFYKEDRRDIPEWVVHVFLARSFDGPRLAGVRALSNGSVWMPCPSMKCGRTIRTGPSLCSRVGGLRDGSITKVTSRNSSTSS